MTAKVINQDDFTYFSIQMLARAFNMSRATVSRDLANIKPSAKRGGYPVYSLADVCAFTAGKDLDAVTAKHDPDNMKPFDRKAWFDSEAKRLQYETEVGRLLVAEDVARVDAEKNKRLALILKTLPDVLERDVGLSADQVKAAERIIDSALAAMYDAICDIEIDAASA